MAVTDLIGSPLPAQTVVVERGPVGFLARAVTDSSPVFQDARAAADAGFDAVPAPPTYAFVMAHQGAWPELQPDGATGEHPLRHVITELMSGGGMILHGGQSFTYHRPVLVGDRLTATGRIADVTVKERGEGSRMTFVVAETDWHDADGAPVVTSSMTLIHRT
ncbi:FAS1-like dehydratase domain-containing protein [Nitriliruptor alkaliphilus]|uniref:FAS1-like dehydratase domain-containing protein n=1 Tax=Nitriliruptor alkaliphilus TaxID=427918 RepID=UPI00069793CC|nr:MaoC family dehydratase N-terminal domain-containing protein [Nitriliruptor alkaliphilus]